MGAYSRERIDDLQRKLPDGRPLRIIQNPDWFCFGTDAVLLANFADVRKGNSVMDLGTGTAIIPLLLAAKTNAGHIDALEIQQEVAEMAKRSIELNQLGGQINVITGDLVGYKTAKQYDVVVCNPPYKKADTGILSKNEKLLIARNEVCCRLHDVISTAARILRPFGRFAMIHRPERLADIICDMREQRIEPKRIQYIHPMRGRPPSMVMVEGVKGAKPYIKTECPLIICGENGQYTEEVFRIYNE